MANIWEKAISILAGNLNLGRSYLITTVRIIFGRSKTLKIIKDIIPRFYIYRLGTLRLQVLPPSLSLCPPPPKFLDLPPFLYYVIKVVWPEGVRWLYYSIFFNESHQWKLGRNVFIITILFCNNNFTFVSTSVRIW